MIDFTVPRALPDLLPFAAACVTLLYGLVALFAPGTLLRAIRLSSTGASNLGLSEIRGTLAGFLLGVGLVTLLFYNQTFVQMALGAGWLLSAFGRLVSMLSDQAGGIANTLLLLLNLLLAGLCLAPVFGLVAY